MHRSDPNHDLRPRTGDAAGHRSRRGARGRRGAPRSRSRRAHHLRRFARCGPLDRVRRAPFALLCLLAAGAGVTGACGEPSAPTNGTGDPVDEDPDWTIDAAGGVVATEDGRLTLEIPPGALDASVTITAEPASAPDSLPVVAGTVWELGPDGTTFAAPVELTIRYDPAEFDGDPSDLRIVEVLQEDGQLEVAHHVGHDPDAHTVTGMIHGFSHKGVAYCDAGCPGPDVTAEYLGPHEGVELSWPESSWPWITIYRAVLRQCEPGESSGDFGPYTCVSDSADALTPPPNCLAPETAPDGRPCRYEVWLNQALQSAGRAVDRGLGPRGSIVWYQARHVGSGYPYISDWMFEPRQVTWLGSPDPPETPEGFSATAVSDSAIRLSWQPTPTAAEYELQSFLGGEWSDLVQLPFSDSEFTDEGLEPDTRYEYRIRSVNEQGASGYATASATTSGGTDDPGDPPDVSGRIAFTTDRDGNMEIYVMDADGTGATRLTDNGFVDDAPAWSPDGSKIAFTRFIDGDTEVYVMDADGTGDEPLTADAGSDVSPDWSPDGSRIVFASNRGTGTVYDIYVMDADGSNPEPLTADFDHDISPAWSPDGSRIAFVRYLDANADIHTIDVDGSNLTRVTTDDAYDAEPAWSPDGSRIAFVSNRFLLNDGETPNLDIYVMDADGSGLVRLTTDPASDTAPVWSPDGDYIAFISDRDGDSEIYLIDADGSEVYRLTDNTVFDGLPAWR